MGERQRTLQRDEQSVSPVVGIILMVAVTVLLATTVGVFSLGFESELTEISGNADVAFEPSPVGLEMTVETVSTTADVRINGETVATIDKGDTGREILLPTAPGDQITVVSGNDQQSVLVDKTAEERDEIGDLLAYYKFDQTTGDLKDYSGNNNDATIVGTPNRTGEEYVFDASQGEEARSDLTAGAEVDELSMFVTFTADSTGSVATGSDCSDATGGCGGQYQQLFEYQSPSLELQTSRVTDDTFRMYEEAPGAPTRIQGGPFETGQTYVAAYTYDGKNVKVYMDGTKIIDVDGTREPVSLSPFRIADQPSQGENFDGSISETRIYYNAFNKSQVDSVSSLMQSED
jgi:FlaG/FlaF family flagellin (archaellin)